MSDTYRPGIWLVLATVLLAGCATSVAQLPKEINPTVTAGEVSLPAGGVVAIQFPLQATPRALAQLDDQYACGYNAFLNHPITSCGHWDFSSQFVPLLFEHSGYYAAELKRLMGRYIDERAVRLEPFVIDYQNQRFSQQPLLPTDTPAVMVIELYAPPSALKESVGAGYMPAVNIRTAGAQSPATCGHLVMVAGHHPFHPPTSPCETLSTRQVPGFAPLHYYAEPAGKQGLVKYPTQNKRIDLGTVTVSQALWEQNDTDYLRLSADESFEVTADTIRNDTSDWIARMSVAYLQLIDKQRTFDQGFAEYVTHYDPPLSERLSSGAPQAADTPRLEIIHKLLLAENDWLEAQDAAIQEGLLNGPYGKSFRQSRLLLAEGYKKAQLLSWLQVGALAAGGLASGLFTSSYNPMIALEHVARADLFFSDAQRRLSTALIDAIAPGTMMRDKVISVTIGNLREQVSGDNLSEIRQQLQAIYRRLAA